MRLADELHVWPNFYLWEALQSGLDKSDNTLMVVATTAGRGQENVAWEQIEDARKVARGEVDDPSILPILFEADRDADWRDEAVWYATNPGLAHGYPSIDGFRRAAAQDLFGRQQITSIVFDVELIHLARRRGYTIAIVPVQWSDLDEGTARIIAFHVGHGASAI